MSTIKEYLKSIFVLDTQRKERNAFYFIFVRCVLDILLFILAVYFPKLQEVAITFGYDINDFWLNTTAWSVLLLTVYVSSIIWRKEVMSIDKYRAFIWICLGWSFYMFLLVLNGDGSLVMLLDILSWLLVWWYARSLHSKHKVLI